MADDDEFGGLPTVPAVESTLPGTLELGAFSASLAVADLEASKAFYEHLGFEVSGGDAAENWLIMKNDETTIGLFHGMFGENILTFNPGLTNRMEKLASFTDVRLIQAQLDEAGIELMQRADADADGPAMILLTDPDGNQILIDQFFPRPA